MQLGIDIIEEDRGLNNFTPSHPIKMQRNILIHKLNQQQEKNWRWWKEIHLSDIRMFKSMPNSNFLCKRRPEGSDFSLCPVPFFTPVQHFNCALIK